MASRLSSREDELKSPLQEDMDEEEEEEVVVKSKVKTVDLENEKDEEVEETRLESHIDTPPNGDLASTMTLRSLTLEVADTDPGEDARSSDYRLWESSQVGEFGLSGPFKVQGRRKILMLEDDMLQWYQKGKEREKGLLHNILALFVHSLHHYSTQYIL